LAVTVCLLRRARNSRSGYPTFVVGASQMALSLIERINNRPGRRSFNIVGIVDTSDYQRNLNTDLPIYHIDQLEAAVKDNGICRLIVIPHHNGKRATLDLVSSLFPTGLQIYVSPTLYYSILGRMPVDDIVGEPLVNISRPFISPMTASFKRFFDVAFSVIAILLLIPIYLAIVIAIKCDSKGPIIYSQERVGYKKRPFKILKFRTMRCDAEENGPSLSSPNDPRVTRVGRFLRKYRLDELPQFVNVLRGDMAIVGPRPEREYYVKQIVSRAPYYSLVHQLRPGITSLGMVKYGYAVDVDQMLDRLKYDLIYLENVSLRVDFKIIYYTISTVLTGRGV
jgi:exopolysaccharide biosynthesis polyprenyl glycosylphosphotransferase